MATTKRLNSVYIQEDIESFLQEKIKNSCTGSYEAVVEWIKQYNANIKTCKHEIEQAFISLFPKAIVRVSESADDASIFSIKIYGIEPNPEEKEIAYELSEKICEIDFGYKYMFSLSFVSMPKTEKFYPEIYSIFSAKNIS
jgi:hypothetical protein